MSQERTFQTKPFNRYDWLKLKHLMRNPYVMWSPESANWHREDEKRMLLIALDYYADYLQGVPNMELEKLAQVIRFDNASQGFDPTEGGVERYLLLTVSEICEAQNELRDGHSAQAIYYDGLEKPYHAGHTLEDFPMGVKPEGFPVEMADAIIRILDIQAKLDFKIKVYPKILDDSKVTLDKELLAVVETISNCYRYTTDKERNLNMALSALFQICENESIDTMEVIKLKLAFNRTRPPKHGRKF